jgi:hypothetical protein
MAHEQGNAEPARKMTGAERLGRDAAEAEVTIDKLGDEALDEYERRRERLTADLTGELPDDIHEPA